MKKLLFPILITLIFFSCKKKQQGLETSGSLEFSTSEVFFDTVFTSIGSTTKRFRVYNRHKQDIEITSISIESGGNSQFRMNVDGEPGTQFKYLLRGNDSMFVFVEVTVNPGDQNAPFVIEDKIKFITNGITQDVKLTAWGQDAHYYRPNKNVQGLPPYSELQEYFARLDTNLVWKADKPHVIYGYLVIRPPLRLNIEAGTQIHFHEGGGLWAFPGAAIIAKGEKDNEVVFQGDRLEVDFAENSGQWDRIWINEGAESSFTHCIIKNGYIGIQAEPFPFEASGPIAEQKLVIQQTTIKNMVGIGMLLKNFNVDVENVLISNIGNFDVALNGGGKMDFKHSTFANYWSGNNRQQPLFFASNYFTNNDGVVQNEDLSATFSNCILYGNKDEEIKYDSTDKADFNIVFDHCILKTELETTREDRYINCIVNPESTEVFASPGSNDYQLTASSVAIEKGNPDVLGIMTQPLDLVEKARASPPDIGALQFK